MTSDGAEPATIAIVNARVLTLAGDTPRRGSAMAELGVIERGGVLIDRGVIADVWAGARTPSAERVIDADGRVLLPCWVDAHTHACWAGDRLDEWELKQRGASYLELLEAGGGIMSTVRAVRAASEDQLATDLLDRLDAMLAHGTATVEVKSGYGLTTGDELKMLRAARAAGERWAQRGGGRVVLTACIGHALDPEVDAEAFVERTIAETLPAVSAAFPGVAIDAYCERGAWNVEQTARLFEAALAAGHPIRVHTDQFTELGMTRWAVEHEAASVDHLEATSAEELQRVARSETFGVMLPCSGFHVDGRYAEGRAFVDAGGALVLATNANPGSAPCVAMPMAIALATRHLGLTAAEAITACTTNAAALLRRCDASLPESGRIEPGLPAAVQLLRHRDERQLGYEFGGNPTDLVICGGRVVFDARAARSSKG